MKPYVIFTFDAYYPAGGWSDFYARFATAEEAFMQIALDHWPAGPHRWEHKRYDGWEVVNVFTGEEIFP